MQPRSVPMPFLVGPDWHFRNMGADRALAQQQLNVGRSGAARLPWLELERAKIGDEIRLPEITAGPDRGHCAFAAVIARQPLALRKWKPIVEEECLVVKDVHEDAQRIGAGEPHR